ncbi:MAG: XRE family transcriptional regulator [Actinomycetota bacterium]
MTWRPPVEDDQKPDWAQRIVAERSARGWSQRDLIEALRRVSTDALPSDASMERSVKGWESGKHKPNPDYRRLIAAAFGTVTLAVFGERPAIAAHAYDSVGTLELVERLRASDLDSTTLDVVKAEVDRLCVDYSWADPHQLLNDATMWLNHLDQLRAGRVTIIEHQRILELAAWLTLLIGTISFDIADLKGAEGARRIALRLGQETGNQEIEAWGYEMAGWFNLAYQRWERVIPTAQAGSAVAGDRGIGAQLAIQEAEALARLGARGEADKALARAQTILEGLPATPNPLHHFEVEHDKFDKALMHIHLIQGDDRQAAMLSDELERKFTNRDGTMTKPMRVADARSVRAVIAGRGGDIDHALELGHSAFNIERQTVPSLVKNTAELAEFLEAGFPNHSGAREFLARRACLAATAGTEAAA